jgi:hypothetical protein
MITSEIAVVLSTADRDQVHYSAGMDSGSFIVPGEIKRNSATFINEPAGSGVMNAAILSLRGFPQLHVRVDDVARAAIWAVEAPVHAVLTLL